MKTEVVVVIGTGGIGMAIARRQGFGKRISLADLHETLLADELLNLDAGPTETRSYFLSNELRRQHAPEPNLSRE